MRENQGKESNKRRRVEIMENDHPPPPPPHLPDDLILHNVLTRLPVRKLCRYECVSKLWYNSFRHDPHFASSHFLQSQNKPRLIFNFLNLMDLDIDSYFFYLSKSDRDKDGDGDEDEDGYNDAGDRLRPMMEILEVDFNRELVGYCNGLFCFSQVGLRPNWILIINPCRMEAMGIFCPIYNGRIICYGFGFDSLTKEYKLVLVFEAVDDQSEHHKCLVYTLGSSSWRETTTIPSSSVDALKKKKPHSRAAIFCDGALIWRMIREPNNEMLLSFDLQNERFQVIQLPAQYVTTTSEKEHSVHVLEFKGSLCVAYLEKELQGPHQGPYRSCKVHLQVLKDKVKQVWIKETFEFESNLSPAATRIMSFCDRVLVHWYDGLRLQLYDLHREHLKGKGVFPYLPDGRPVLKEEFLTDKEMEYQLHSYIENFRSLVSFLPEGACRFDVDALNDMLEQEQQITAGVYLALVRGESVEHYSSK